MHAGELAGALQVADRVLFFRPAELAWDAAAALQPLGDRVALFDSSEAIIEALAETAQPGDHLLIMSNGGFEGLHRRLLERLGRG
ncbi:hypothetical protein QQ73_12645 [Candidatus Endoriftia persephone str. Guaymas]|nr:hypothetical protein [Candidatus Endoriftia persephone str. Guaymas]